MKKRLSYTQPKKYPLPSGCGGPTAFACLILLALAINTFAFTTGPVAVTSTAVPADYVGSTFQLKNAGMHMAHVLRVIDGDTFEAAVVIWPDVVVTKKFRIHGIDTPESRPRKKDHLGRVRSEADRQSERDDAAEAKRIAQRLLMGTRAIVWVRHAGRDKYGRELVDVYVQDDRTKDERYVNYSAILIERGFAVPYFGAKKNTWKVE